MPYIKPEARKNLLSHQAVNPGALNYNITSLCNDYLYSQGVNYATLNEIVGVLECAKLEFYRRMAVPYENQKMFENGDVYGPKPVH